MEDFNDVIVFKYSKFGMEVIIDPIIINFLGDREYRIYDLHSDSIIKLSRIPNIKTVNGNLYSFAFTEEDAKKIYEQFNK